MSAAQNPGLCTCKCHRSYDGVDVRNPIHAASACDTCLNAHAAAMSNDALSFDATAWTPDPNEEEE